MDTQQPVCVIYAGGTIGMVPIHPEVPDSPLVPGTWDQLVGWTPQLDRLGVPVRAVSVARPVDSSDMSPAGWVEIADLIRTRYDDACGFVVLHGTDTMSYTATALSFMLQGLSKPVVVTGSQLPITDPRTDAVQNFVTALTVAAGPQLGLPSVPEVCLFFRDHLFRGCRTTKVSASSCDAFDSPNYPPLADAGERIRIHRRRLRPPGDDFQVRTQLSPGVITTRLSPGLDSGVLKAVLNQPEVEGVILETYGAGNAPTNAEFLDTLRQAIAGGTHIVNVTQCVSGRVDQGRYQASAGLLEAGVLSGLDMTTEAAKIKLQILLGEHRHDTDTVRQRMQTNMVGEQSGNIHTALFGAGSVAGTFTSEAVALPVHIEPNSVRVAYLRLFRARHPGALPDQDLLRAYFDLGPHQGEPGPDSPRYAGRVRRASKSPAQGETLSINVADALRRGVLEPARPVRFTLCGQPQAPVEWERALLHVETSAE
ncbi:MAG: type I asparaginase [Phycisphaerae bacterium]